MTVTVRPVPKRTYQNGIRPFRPVVPANNIRPYTLKTWRPPVPEPLPPAPLLGPKELLGLGVLVLAQLWGLFASRSRKTVASGGLEEATVTGLIGAEGGTVDISVSGWRRQHSCTITPTTQCFGPELELDARVNQRRSYGPNGGDIARTITPGVSCGVDVVSFVADPGGFSNVPSASLLANIGGICGDITRYTVNISYSAPIGSTRVPSLEFSPDTTQTPTPLPEIVPEKPRVPLLPPLITPAVPGPSAPAPTPETGPSVVPTTPGPTAPPAVQPRLPQRTLPPRIPGASATRDGVLVPQAPAPIAVTPGDAHFPIPGGAPVLGNGPQPKPEAIAQELGRIEQKLNILSNPNTDGMGDGSDRMGLITNILGRLLEFMTSITAGGGYSLSSPCEVDEAGNPVVSVVEYGGATDALGVLSNKIDALAGVMQIHKNLKQPICKQTPAVGENVTVNFVQVD